MPSKSSGGQRERSAITGHFIEQEHKGVTHMNRPRVTASQVIESIDMHDYSGGSQKTPHVEVCVEFDLHDHEAALLELDRAVTSVRSQIQEAS